MTDLTDFQLTDLVDDHEAEDINILRGGVLKALYTNTETITTTKELADSDCQIQIITPSGADRTVELPPEATTNHVHFIKNPSGTSYNLIIKDDSGTTTYATLNANEWALCIPAGSAWHIIESDPPNGSAVLASSFSITAADGVYEDTGLNITLPEAGTYLVTCNIRAKLKGNTGTDWFLLGKLYNSTDAADVANTETLLVRTMTTDHIELTTVISILITVTAAKTIKLYVARSGNGTPTWTTSEITSNSNGRTRMLYTKIGR